MGVKTFELPYVGDELFHLPVVLNGFDAIKMFIREQAKASLYCQVQVLAGPGSWSLTFMNNKHDS